jgi:hypothetical protein
MASESLSIKSRRFGSPVSASCSAMDSSAWLYCSSCLYSKRTSSML